MTVKITLEFEGVDQAIVALGKLTGAPPVAAKPRKGRDDKGQKREPYGPRGKGQPADSSVEERTREQVGTLGAQGTEGAVTVPAKAEDAATSTTTVASVVPVLAALTAEDAQNAFEKYFNSFSGQTAIDKGRALLAQFGAKRVGEIPAEKRADFIEAARV